MRKFWRWSALIVGVLAGLVCAGSIWAGAPWTRDDIISTVIYGLVCVGGLVVFWTVQNREKSN